MDFADDPEFRSLIREFAQQFPARRDALRAALEQDDFRTVADAAHKLAGCASAYGFDELGQRARQCEQAIVGGGDAPTCRRQGEALVAALDAAEASSRAA